MTKVRLKDATGSEFEVDYAEIQKLPEHLEELDTASRIRLVEKDDARRWGQITISLVLIAASLAGLGLYIEKTNDTDFFRFVAYGMAAIILAAIGSAYNLFGLGGRAVGKRPTS